MPTILASGFGPFPPWTDNPSWDALVTATPELPTGWQLIRLRLDVAWDDAPARFLACLDDDVRVAIAFGQADDAAVRIERFAVNASNGELLDVNGLRFEADHIVADGPPAYETRLPRRRLLGALHAVGMPAVESHSAGGYLCNHTFYRLLHALQGRSDVCAGFVHVPPAARMAVEQTRLAMERVIEETIAHTNSIEGR